MITPTHPVEGDWLKIETEEAIFGLLFAWMGFWMFKQLRGLWRYWAEAKARAAMDPTGVDVVDDSSMRHGRRDEDVDPTKTTSRVRRLRTEATKRTEEESRERGGGRTRWVRKTGAVFLERQIFAVVVSSHRVVVVVVVANRSQKSVVRPSLVVFAPRVAPRGGFGSSAP